MTNARTPSIKPFVEQVSLIDKRLLRVGYRAEGSDSFLASLELPVELLEHEIAAGLELVTTISPSGEIVSLIFGSSGLVLGRSYSTVSIDRLVSQTVDSDNLRLEELPTSELNGLLRSLEASIEYVRTALAQRA
ncbi:hypothetical protein [Bradyrhizobium japonicum]|jgi:hypothetical protein|uniref:hypothetical protein n=1 Tax=Bradyrhizobium japonicum TaxID=375 RepID=UPI00209E5850|nr:hypothetical protein [Bradyrhizobium japonicum]MCP1762385.1 hypothetical protein [Bradyrhizobium japonicum]MCP1793965.1 hypothetical protein [Bradyrhizobium japonicum]MCP1806398.1 hypothetical protein [Bradyrhizobium japonicum]MCP1815326.1 hypothetical protein [Bradyrhizobium japonicum]MCP1873157.1 hypothetical protein [Bradyrhizobium japonicum]